MSSEATPINPARFAEALKDLPLETLHFKGAEIRNSIAHLDYSNEQLRPFAEGTEASCNGIPDEDCKDAIQENEAVIVRMQERIALLRTEVESRGSSWLEFSTLEELATNQEEQDETELVNGTSEEERSSAWTDGTFQTGRIVGGEVQMDDAQSNSTANGTAHIPGTSGATTNGSGGRIDDESLRRAMEDRMRELARDGDDGDEGMHL